MSFVPFEEFQVRYENTVPAADEERIAALLEDACALAADIVGAATTAAWGDGSGTDAPGAVVSTVCTAVRRAYENPLGLQGETIGDYSWRAAGSAQGVYLTTSEQRVIRRAVGRSSVGTLELQGMLPDSVSGEQYLGVSGGGEPVLYFGREDLP